MVVTDRIARRPVTDSNPVDTQIIGARRYGKIFEGRNETVGRIGGGDDIQITVVKRRQDVEIAKLFRGGRNCCGLYISSIPSPGVDIGFCDIRINGEIDPATGCFKSKPVCIRVEFDDPETTDVDQRCVVGVGSVVVECGC